jgi:hypothetical protein
MGLHGGRMAQPDPTSPALDHAANRRGSRRYVRRLQKRYMPNPHLDPDPPEPAGDGDSSPPEDPSLRVPVVFFSLLRKGTPDKDRSEAKLAEAFDYVAAQVRLCVQQGLHMRQLSARRAVGRPRISTTDPRLLVLMQLHPPHPIRSCAVSSRCR